MGGLTGGELDRQHNGHEWSHSLNVVQAAVSIVGVTTLRQEDPVEFGSFSRAFCTLFRIVAGETWCQEL